MFRVNADFFPTRVPWANAQVAGALRVLTAFAIVISQVRRLAPVTWLDCKSADWETEACWESQPR